MNLFSTKQLDKFKEQWSYIDKVLLSILILFFMMLSAFSAMAQAPSIVSLSPANLSAHVDRNLGTLTMELSETVVAGSLADSYDQFELRILYQNPIIQSFEVDDANQVTISGSTITLKNVQTLAYGTSYYISFSRSGIVVDLEGEHLPAMVGNGTWRFTTQQSDLVVTSSFPSNGAQFIEPDAETDFTLTFNQTVNSSLTTKYAYMSEVGGSSVQSWTLTSTNDVTYNGNSVTLKRSVHQMQPGKEYYIYTSADAFRDDNGRYFEGIGNAETDFWHFYTKTEVIAPEVGSLSPAHESEGVARDISTFNIRLNESVTVNTRSRSALSLYRVFKSSPTLIDQIAADEITSDGKGGYNLPFDYGASLEEGYQYYIEIPGDIFYDSQENYFAGTDETSWSFFANRKPTKINLSSSTVLENQPAGTVVGTVSATDPDYRDDATVTLIGGTHVSSFQIVGSELRTTEEFDYESGTTKSITLRATDNAGEYLNSAITIYVGDVDDTPPVLLTSDPDDGATGVDLSPTLTYTFDEEIALTNATTSTFYLVPSAGGSAVRSWQAVEGTLPAGMSIVGNQMIFEVSGALGYNTSYYMSAPEIADLAGNEGFAFSNESFTTRAISSEKEVLAATIPGIVGEPVIDNENNTITATVQATNPSRLEILLDVSPGASYHFSSNPQYYQNGVGFPMTLRAENNSSESWTISLNWEELQGNYTVGDNGTFATISDAVGQLGLAGMSGDVVFEVEDGYNVTKTVFLSNPDPTHHVTIRPQSGATQIDLYPESNYSAVFRINNVISNMTIDGADPSTGNVVMNLNANIDYVQGVLFLGSGTYDFTLKNLRFNILNTSGVQVSNGTTEVSGIDIIGCEFIAANAEPTESVIGIWMRRTNHSDINIIGNKFYNHPDSPDPASFTAIAANDDLTDVINNSISIRGNSTFGIGRAINVLHNSINLYGSGSETTGNHYAIGYGENIQNNNVSIKTISANGTTRRFVHYSNMQAEDAGNNVHIVNDGASITRYALNAADQTEMSAIASTTTYIDAQFTDESTADLSLSGSSYTEEDLRTGPVDGVDTDILGNSRSASWPSKGAYEVPNRASDFLTFSIPQQLSDPVINKDNHTVTVAVNAGTSLENLVPTFTISPGASISPSGSGDEQDFTNPFSYFITDEQEFAQQEWVVTVSEQNLPPSDIELDPSTIDENQDAGTVVGVLSGTDPNGDELIFSIVGGDGSQHGYLFEIDSETNELKSKAPFDFEQNEELYIRIEADDQAGETYDEALVIYVGDLDEIAPDPEGYGPANGDTGVTLDTELYVQYNEDVIANTGSYYLRTADGQLVEQIAVDGSGVNVSRAVVTITPSQNLKYNTTYYIEAVANVVTDEAGNAAPAIAEGDWSFTTENPISSLSPADEADDVSPFANIELTFDRTVSHMTGGTFRMFRTADDVQVGTNWSFNGATQDGNTISYDIPMNLEPGVEIYLQIIDGIEDEEGNPIDILDKDTWNFTPVKLDQTVTLNEIPSKVFGDAGFTFTAATASSGQNTFTYTTTDPNVADLADNYITITGAGTATIRATQVGNTYYNPAFAEQEFTVAKADQGIMFTEPDDMTYGDAPQTLSATLSPSGDEVTFEIIAGDAVTLDTETNELTIVGTGEVTVRASGLESDNYNAPIDVDKTFTVNKKVVTASVSDEEKIYGEVNPIFVISYDGFIDGESSDMIDVKPVANTEADAFSNAGLYDVTLSGGEDDNYEIALEHGFLRIHKKELVATADDKSKVYGEANPSFSLSFEGFIDGDNASDLIGTLPIRSTSADASSNVGEYTITVSGGEDLNYEFVPQDGTLTITHAELTVSADDAEKNYGDEVPKLTYEITGFKNEEDSDVLSEMPDIITTATAEADAGTYPITVSGGGADNYTFGYTHATLYVNKVSLEAAVQSATRVYGEPNDDFVIEYDGFVNGDDEFDLDNPMAVTTSADENSNVGEYVLDLLDQEDTNYEIVTVDGTLTITRAEQIVEIEDISDKVKNAEPFDIIANVNSGAELNYDVSGPATNDGNTITLTGALGTVTVTVSAAESLNYSAASEQVTFEVNDKETQTISFAITDQTYGNTVSLNGESSSGLIVTYGNLSGPISLDGNTLNLTGVGEASITAYQSGDEVYNEAEPEVVTFTISKAALMVTAHDQSMTYGEELPDLTFEYDGFVNGEDALVLNEEPGVSTVDASSDAGTYDITLSGGSADNYELTLVNGTLTIGKADPVLSVAGIADKTIADDPFSIDVTIDTDQTLNYSVEGPATVSTEGLVTLDGTAGEVTVTVLATANTNHNEASESVSFSVIDNSLKTQTITIEAIADKLTSDEAFEVVASATSELEVELTVTGPATISEDNIITLDGTAGTVTVFGNQAGNDEFDAAEEVSITFEVTEPVVSSVSRNIEINVFPNPATEWITLNGLTAEANLQLINTEGHLVMQQKVNGRDQVDVSSVARGIYILRIQENNSYTTTKILIH